MSSKKNMITIPASKKDDPFYRYSRHKLEVVQIEKNGGQTAIKNLEVVAKELGRTAEHLAIFLANECKCKCLEKDGSHILSGRLASNDLETKLEKYITGFVLCSHCRNPETVPIESPDLSRAANCKRPNRTCKACGRTTQQLH